MRLTGPDDSTPCEVLGNLRIPVSATAAAPAVALLSTNGLGGSKDDDGPRATAASPSSTPAAAASRCPARASASAAAAASSSSPRPSGTARSPTSSRRSSPAAPGHCLAVVLAAGDSGHRGNTLAGDVTVTTSAASPGVLELPTTGLPPLVPLLAMAALGTVGALRRRRTP